MGAFSLIVVINLLNRLAMKLSRFGKYTLCARCIYENQHSIPNRTFKIYTKTGDKGRTSLYSGERVSKTDVRFEALGSIDELSSAIGICRILAQNQTELSLENVTGELHRIQCRLQDIGTVIATLPPKEPNVGFDEVEINEVESSIDSMTSQIPELKSFIIPGGGIVSSNLHVARTVCRRAERRCLEIDPPIDAVVLKYLNRLSDYLFTVALYAAYKTGSEDDIYVSPRVSDII